MPRSSSTSPPLLPVSDKPSTSASATAATVSAAHARRTSPTTGTSPAGLTTESASHHDHHAVGRDSEFLLSEPSAGGGKGRSEGLHSPLLSSSSSSVDGRSSLTLHSNELESFDMILDDNAAKSSVVGATLNFTNSIIGAGIIGLPYAFKEAGFVLGVVLLVVLAFLVAWTVVLLVKCGKMVSKTSYQDLVNAAFNGRGQFLITFFHHVRVPVIIGDSLPPVLKALFGVTDDPWYFSRSILVISSTLFVTLPLSMQRDMAALAKTSAVSMVSIILIVTAVIFSAFSVPDTLRGDPTQRFTVIGDSPAKAIGVISFAFVCHHNTFIIFSSLSTPTLDRFSRVTNLSAGISLVACLILALAGFWTFTDKTQGNVLNNFPPDHLGINLARLAFTLNMYTTYPMELFVARHVMEDYLYPGHKAAGWARHTMWTVGLVMASLLVAVGVQDVSVILEVTGGVAATALAYILPPWCWLRLAGSHKWKCWGCIAFGIVAMVLSFVR
ncbi:transmembrane amino acid transporter protein-domain-containing protein [Catenaria anguillulae PL171]|uniref:Transmembrane amino acid transporter protein-domain-containing protein n=1 Tax=Catenaria anguillulae PL171 TaxID=765915 RepID=A0A1Y2HRF4_9FUNG|nr:transmembrane amino acid transporter protein-domain-containing protein [Catenaria anguillulae PL171]